ncbi:hypothetical protein GCM10009647_084810 [Streptomyces sanglieri]
MPVNGMDLLLLSEFSEWSIATATEEIVCFGWSESGRAIECEVFERRFGVFFAVEDGDAVIHLGSPEAVMS